METIQNYHYYFSRNTEFKRKNFTENVIIQILIFDESQQHFKNFLKENTEKRKECSQTTFLTNWGV